MSYYTKGENKLSICIYLQEIIFVYRCDSDVKHNFSKS